MNIRQEIHLQLLGRAFRHDMLLKQVPMKFLGVLLERLFERSQQYSLRRYYESLLEKILRWGQMETNEFQIVMKSNQLGQNLRQLNSLHPTCSH